MHQCSIEGLDPYRAESVGKTHVQTYHNAAVQSPKWSAGRSKGTSKSQGSWDEQADRRSPRILQASWQSRQLTPPGRIIPHIFWSLVSPYGVSASGHFHPLIQVLPDAWRCCFPKLHQVPCPIAQLHFLVSLLHFFSCCLLTPSVQSLTTRELLIFETCFHPWITFSRPLKLPHI